MLIFGYLRASTDEQDAKRAMRRLDDFVVEKGERVAAWYTENQSGASLQRPELMRLIDHAQEGDILLIEQVDRLTRLNDADWNTLKHKITEKGLHVVSLDLPTSHLVFQSALADDDFTRWMFKALNSMMLDMLAAISRKDYADRRRRAADGIAKAKAEGKYKGKAPNTEKHQQIIKLYDLGVSISQTASMVGVSKPTVSRVRKLYKEGLL